MKTRRLRNMGFHVSLAAGSLHGVVEAESASGEQFDEARVLKDSWGRPPAEILDEVLGGVRGFLDQGQAQDDPTRVVVRIASPRVDDYSRIPERAGVTEVL